MIRTLLNLDNTFVFNVMTVSSKLYFNKTCTIRRIVSHKLEVNFLKRLCETAFRMYLNLFLQTNDADTKMNTLDDNMMKICKILKGIDKSKAECLRTFISCKPLVVWLRETMSKFEVYLC